MQHLYMGKMLPMFSQINWAKHYPNCERYKKMWQDALNGSFQDGVRLVDNSSCVMDGGVFLRR